MKLPAKTQRGCLDTDNPTELTKLFELLHPVKRIRDFLFAELGIASKLLILNSVSFNIICGFVTDCQ